MKKALQNRIVALFMVLIMAISFFAGCGEEEDNPSSTRYPETTDAPHSYDEEDPTENGTLTVAVKKEYTLNPLLINNRALSTYLSLVCEPLYAYDENMGLKPVLATSYVCDSEFKVWEVTIKRNVKFGDGTYLTINDVIATFNYASKHSGTYGDYFDNVAGFFVKDSYTFQAVLYEPDANFLYKMTLPILAASSLSEYIPVGTGLFNIKSYGKSGFSMHLSENYHDNTKKPHITTVTVKYYDTEYEAMASEYDLGFVFDGNVTEFVLDGTRIAKYFTGDVFNFMAINTSAKCNYAETIETKKITQVLDQETGEIVEKITKETKVISKEIDNPLANSKMREALNLLVSRQNVVTNAGSGHGTISLLPGYSGTASRVQQKNDYDVDTFTAVQNIRSLGYVKNADGKYEDANGNLLIITILTVVDNAKLSAMARVLRDALENIGVTTELDAVTYKVYSDKIDRNEYMVVANEITLDGLSDFANVFGSGSPYNASNYSNALLDDEIRQLNSTNNNEIKKATYAIMENILLDDCPIIGCYISSDAIIIGDNLAGITVSKLNSWNLLDDFCNWYIRWVD